MGIQLKYCKSIINCNKFNVTIINFIPNDLTKQNVHVQYCLSLSTNVFITITSMYNIIYINVNNHKSWAA